MMNDKIVSIIMATYNSSNTIKRSLESIREQNINQSLLEIIVVDGGSTDNTQEIAKSYGVKLLFNERVLPEFAKRIGLKNATGKYVLIMDSDEVFPNNDLLRKRIQFMDKHSDLKCIIGGYKPPKDSSFIGEYYSLIGDPFSAFVYNWYIGGNIGIIKKHAYIEDEFGYIGKFSEKDVYPIGDSVTMMDRRWIVDNCLDMVDKENTTSIFNYIAKTTKIIGHVNGDYMIHYTKSSFNVYMKKLKFRIINNIFDVNGSGYSALCSNNKKLQRRKYIYPFYCISVVLPFIDGIRMAVYYKNPSYLFHPFFTWYIFVEILVQYSFKLLGIRKENRTYA